MKAKHANREEAQRTLRFEKQLEDARRCMRTVEGMTDEELDAWYEQHVGYRLREDSPTMGRRTMMEMVAAAMFYRTQPDGIDTENAELTEARMSVAIQFEKTL